MPYKDKAKKAEWKRNKRRALKAKRLAAKNTPEALAAAAAKKEAQRVAHNARRREKRRLQRLQADLVDAMEAQQEDPQLVRSIETGLTQSQKDALLAVEEAHEQDRQAFTAALERAATQIVTLKETLNTMENARLEMIQAILGISHDSDDDGDDEL